MVHMCKKINYSLFLIMLSFFLCLGIQSAHATVSENKAWSVATIIGSFSQDSSFKYYLEPQLRLIDNNSVFNQLLFLGALGYQFNKDMTLFAGSSWIAAKTMQSDLMYEKRFWQQFNWQMLSTENWNINSRTRLEERINQNEAPTAFRFRERIWLRIPLKKWEGYSFSSYDEVFFNLNHPKWVSPYLLEQNRVFVGLSRQLSQSVIMDVGYLNQYQHSFKNQMDHVASLGFTLTN